MIRVNIKVNMKKSLVLLLLVLLVGCGTPNRSQVGAILGGATTTSSCVAMGVNDPYSIGACAVFGAFAGAEIMYNSDYDVHYATFVDHLNTSPSKTSYTNWYNMKTRNSGIIKTNSSYLRGPIKCKDYSSTVDITNNWPLVGIGGVNRREVFGTVCQMPDGQWKELHYNG